MGSAENGEGGGEGGIRRTNVAKLVHLPPFYVYKTFPYGSLYARYLITIVHVIYALAPYIMHSVYVLFYVLINEAKHCVVCMFQQSYQVCSVNYTL